MKKNISYSATCDGEVKQNTYAELEYVIIKK